MRLALWTPVPARPEVLALAAGLREEAALELVAAEPQRRPAADLDLYHLADDPAHGFVYRALLARPGLLWLCSRGLHALVHAETAGRGDTAAYLREARRANGPKGAFLARQVLDGRGGALLPLLTLRQRALDSALAVVVPGEELRGEIAREVEVPVIAAPLAERAAGAILALAAQAATAVAEAARQLALRREQEDRPLGRALDELRFYARELGLGRLPLGVEPRLLDLLAGPRRSTPC